MGSYHIVERCVFETGDVINNLYTVRKTLGEGSFGAVYQVTDQRGQPYALKLLRLWEVPSDTRQPLTERFEKEYQTGQIDCENLVRSIDYDSVGGNPYIVMEFCSGGDLNPMLGNCEDQAPRICQDILNGLHALHARKIVHRDLKPENVLFKENGKAALTDFGIVGDRLHRMTQLSLFGKPDQVFGTYAYMPPEQANRARGGATVMPTTDIFSFGVLAYQLLTGHLPFGQLESHNDLVDYQKRGKEGLWHRSVLNKLHDGQQWMKLIEGCLQPDFKLRIQAVEEVIRQLPKGVEHSYLLKVVKGEEPGRVYNLSQLFNSQGSNLTVGRQQGNAVVIRSERDNLMSRFHCTIEANTGHRQWKIRDGHLQQDQQRWVASRNGTKVNGRSIPQSGFYLKSGDTIIIGDAVLKFEYV